MRATWIGGCVVVLGSALAAGAPLVASDALAGARYAQHSPGHHGGGYTPAAHASASAIQAGMSRWSGARERFFGSGYRSVARYGRVGGGLQCVPFARENSGIELSGNASSWWANAEGVYERGARPEVGSVLNFRANGRMHMGHVAVVANVVNGRNIEIDHANWSGPGGGRGSVTRNITVVDVSERNDWSAVRVALGHTGEFGSIYPTYGFIYDRPDHGTMVANAGTAPAPVLNAPPRDLRPVADRYAATTAPQEIEEVAEAADDMPVRGHRIVGSTRHVHGTTDRFAHGTNERFARATTGRFTHGTSDRFAHGPAERFGSRTAARTGNRVSVVQVHARSEPSAGRPAAHRHHL